jgi:hypothetical protein
MKKTVVTVALVLLAGLVVAGAASAWCTWGGSGGWSRGGYGTRYGTVDTERFRNFQKDTLSLREEMMSKNLELQNEYSKPTPDPKRVAALEKETIDLQTKIQEVADKYGISGQGRGYPGRGMMGPGWCAWDNW